MCDAVPVAYQGVWRRILLETPQGRDADSRVYWLQTRHWHADLRVPAGRPDFTRIQSLSQCTSVHLQWLLRQEGFAGITQIDGELCEWHRRMDYRSDTFRDIGCMRFCECFLEELGVERQYREEWQQEGEMRILLSTLPWLEGVVLPHSEQWLNISGENNE